MQILLYSGFNKRENSTKTPLVSAATVTLTGYLREPCSIMHPVINIEQLSSGASPQSYTYAYIPEFARWYFISDWTWNNGTWACSMSVDVLSSFKTNIGNSSAYIERSAYEYNGSITDRYYPTTTYFQTEKVNLTASWYNVAPSGGCYVVGIICNANRASSQIGGAVTYYVMTPAQMGSMMSYLLGSTFLDDQGFPTVMTTVQQLAHDTAKVLVNPIEYIASCMWLPISKSVISDNADHDIVLGYFDTGSNVAKGSYLTAVVFTMSATGVIPTHPQALSRGSYLNYSPFTRLTLNIPPFGSIPLDTSFCEIGNHLLCRVWIDPITGKATMRVELYPDSQHTGTGAIVCESSTMMGVPIQLAQLTPDYLSMIGAGLKVAAGTAASENTSTLGLIANAVSGIGDAVDAMMPQVERHGVSGSFLSTAIPPQLTAQYSIVVDEDNTEFGKPLCEIRQISTQAGYVKCKDAHVDFSCYEGEKQKILNYMISGFFWE